MKECLLSLGNLVPGITKKSTRMDFFDVGPLLLVDGSSIGPSGRLWQAENELPERTKAVSQAYFPMHGGLGEEKWD